MADDGRVVVQMDRAAFAGRVAAFAGALRAAGVTAGECVAVCLPRSAEQVIALAAIHHCGAAYLPLDPAWPRPRQAALLTQAQATALIAAPEHGARIADGIPVLAPSATGPAEAAHAVQPDDIAYVIFTSGSTGAPRAVEVSHGNLGALIAWHCAAFALGPGTRSAHLAGLAFDAAAWEVWPVLASGGTLVLPADDTVRLDPARLAQWLVAAQVEVAFAPTAIAEALIARDWPADVALRVLLTGADRLRRRPRGDLPFVLVNNYGPTECTVVATSGPVAAQGDDLPDIGRPISGTTVHLLDAAGEPVRDGQTGEIWIGGAGVARGYRGDAALTTARFVDHPRWGRLYRSGDLAWRDAAGALHFAGRVDQQIKVRGHRIEPAEIEAALLAISGVAAAAVDVRAGDLAAWIVPAPCASPTAGALRTALAVTLPAAMIPSHLAQVAALPMTANGKLDRAALPDPASCALPETVTARQPATPTEARLAQIVAEAIGRSDFGMDDDFFLLGGHSLLGTQVIIKARAAFGIDLGLLHLFEARSVTRLAAVIEELVAAHLDSLSDEDIARLMAG